MAFIMTNKANANSVIVYRRLSSGQLSFAQEVPTLGLGTGVTNDPLMSQGALALSDDGKVLLAVNAASAELTAFSVTPSGLKFGSKVPTGGALPVSVTVHNGYVYVLHQLGIANIVGFTVDAAAKLKPLAGSARILPGGPLALPAEVRFAPNGSDLLVTEKGTDLIDVFKVLSDGRTAKPTPYPSSGKTPFGFTFGNAGTVIVSEAERRYPREGTTSSYRLTHHQLVAVSSAVPDEQTAACWVTLTGSTAWVVNTLTSAVSSYSVSGTGALALANSIAAMTGMNASPTDIASSADGKFVYVLNSAFGGVAGYSVNGATLTPVFHKTGLPLSIAGLVVE